MLSSPRFKVTVQGVAAGCHPQRVRAALASRFGLSPAQVEQLLCSQGGLLAEPVDHQTAWQLKSLLQQLGVDCRIAPVPLAGLGERADRIRLHPVAPGRHVGQAPRRLPDAPRSARIPRPDARPAEVAMGRLWSLVAVVLVVFVLAGYLQSSRSPATLSALPVEAALR